MPRLDAHVSCSYGAVAATQPQRQIRTVGSKYSGDNQSTTVRMPRLNDNFFRAECRNIDQLRAAADQRIGGLCMRQRRQVDAATAARLGDGV